MIAIGLLFVRMLCDCFKSRPRLEAEILVLRHQLNVLQQARACGKYPRTRIVRSAPSITRHGLRVGGAAAVVVSSLTQPRRCDAGRPIGDARVPQAIGQPFDRFVPAEAEVPLMGAYDSGLDLHQAPPRPPRIK